MPSTPNDDVGRESSDDVCCVYLLLCLLILVTLAGGSFLLLYIILPDSENTGWLLSTGMVLVSIPWVFYIMVFIYRLLSARYSFRESSPVRRRSITPTTTACLYLLPYFLFLLTLAGICFLLLCVGFPESENSTWFLWVGMVMVAIPWVLWITTFIYGKLSAWYLRRESSRVRKRPTTTAVVSPVAVKDSAEGDETKGDASSGGAPSTRQLEGNEDSSVTSYDSEKPLTFSSSLQ